MRITATITVRRDDGVDSSTTVDVETQRVWRGRDAGFGRETKAETMQRFNRLLAPAINRAAR